MEFSSLRNDLLKSVNISLKAVPSHTTMDILTFILIDTTEGDITFVTNNMDMGIETKVNGTVKKRGRATVDAKVFSDIIRKLPDGEVDISLSENFIINISCEQSRFTISGRDPDEFTGLPDIERENSIQLPQIVLRNLITKTVFAVSVEEIGKKIMTGENFSVKDNYLKLTALDGNRIAIKRTLLADDYDDASVIVPSKTLTELSKILSDDIDDIVTVYLTQNHILFDIGDTIIESGLIEGKYFDTDKYIINDYNTKININKRQLLDCIDRSLLLLRDNDKSALVFKIENDIIHISITSKSGCMSEDIDIEKEGNDITIGFNPKIMIDCIKSVDDETLTIYFISSISPCFIRDGEDNYIYMILPLNMGYV